MSGRINGDTSINYCSLPKEIFTCKLSKLFSNAPALISKPHICISNASNCNAHISDSNAHMSESYQ